MSFVTQHRFPKIHKRNIPLRLTFNALKFPNPNNDVSLIKIPRINLKAIFECTIAPISSFQNPIDRSTNEKLDWNNARHPTLLIINIFNNNPNIINSLIFVEQVWHNSYNNKSDDVIKFTKLNWITILRSHSSLLKSICMSLNSQRIRNNHLHSYNIQNAPGICMGWVFSFDASAAHFLRGEKKICWKYIRVWRYTSYASTQRKVDSFSALGIGLLHQSYECTLSTF